ncbi:MAG TPA: glycosyltransferase family 2 protein [Hyphomicrobium sp.]|mgnify:CR=1 FL=1|nr:glycosyltransferase family 2 protein [Hyphomicrobium sp.]
MAVCTFWIAVLLVSYSYVLYPLVLAALVRIRPAPVSSSTKASATHQAPAVACIIAAYNEERHIAARVENVLTQTYDTEKLTLYVGSDGSRDRTAERLEDKKGDRVKTFVFDKNRGKASVLNDLVAASTEPILVFSDANAMFEADAVARLVDRFRDPAVGAVCGELQLLDASGTNQDSAYWRIEQFLKLREAELDGLLGANGAIYALRRDCFRPLAPDTIIDDFCIAMSAVADGWRLVYEPAAKAIEDTPDSIADEYHRRTRIGIGNYQAFFRHPEFFTRTNAATRFTYVSHKVLRWFTPHLMLVALIASAIAARQSSFYFALFSLQIAAYGAAAVIWRFNLAAKLPGIVRMIFMLLTLNWAFLVAFAKFVTGRYSGSWRTTARSFEKSGSTPN